jgi:pilus assembly protein Flp/PilA
MTARRSPVKRALLSWRRLLTDKRGATAIEYGLIVTLIVIAMISALMTVADTTTSMWNGVSEKVTKAG